jgi:hypothetical protein
MKKFVVLFAVLLFSLSTYALPTYPPPTILTNLEEYFLTNDPVLADGEFAYCTDTHTLKIGDGVTQWTVLVSVGEPLLTSVVGVPKSVLTMYNPSLTYTSRSFLFSASNGNYIDLTDSVLYRITSNDMTISFFLKASSVTGNQVIMCRGSYGGDVGYYLQLNEGYFELYHGQTCLTRWKESNYLNRWVHVVLMKEGGGGIWRAYKNGMEVSYDIQESGDPVTCNNVLYFGAYDNFSNYFSGAFSDIKFFDRMLSQAEIDDLYLGVESVATSDLIGWWRCNETGGDTINDSSASNVDGLQGGSYDDVFFNQSPYTKAVLTGIFYKYVECLGGRVMDPLSPFCGFEIPDYGQDNDIIWAWKVFP